MKKPYQRMKGSTGRNPLRNDRGDISIFTCFFVVGIVMLVSFLLLYTVCPHGQSPPCGGFLMAVDADGSPILMPAKVLKQISGESIEPEECRAVLGKQTFETVYGLYIEWHTVSSTDCPLLELCQTSHQCRCL